MRTPRPTPMCTCPVDYAKRLLRATRAGATPLARSKRIDLRVMFRTPGELLANNLYPSLSLLHPNGAESVESQLPEHPLQFCPIGQFLMPRPHLLPRLGPPLAWEPLALVQHPPVSLSLAQPPPARPHGPHCSPRIPFYAPLRPCVLVPWVRVPNRWVLVPRDFLGALCLGSLYQEGPCAKRFLRAAPERNPLSSPEILQQLLITDSWTHHGFC